MSWLQIIGYEREKEILQRAVLEKRLPNAYCFSGFEGIGKEALAIQFAKTVNCEQPVITDDTIDSCDKCKSCKKIDALSHDNLFLVYPLPAGSKPDSKSNDPLASLSDEQIEYVKEELTKKKEDNYYKISIPNANQIKISSVRQIKKQLSLSASTSGRRVVIISGAERMTGEAANSFLKTLEEPHANITIILVTSKPEFLLPTILSRCQQLNFGPMNEELIAKALVEKNGFETDNARIAAAFGQGSYMKALASADEDMQELRLFMIEMLRSLFKKKFRIKLIEKVDALEKMKDKNKLETALTLLLLWLRDAYKMQVTGEKEDIVNADEEKTIVNFVNFVQKRDISKALTLTEEAIAKIRRNVSVHLILLSLFGSLREILLDKG